MPRTAITLCEQLGRFWAERSPLDLTFVEADDAAPGHIYAAPLPGIAGREATAVSITPGPSPGPEGMDVTRVQTVILEARAETAGAALSLLADLRGLLRPGERPFADPTTGGIIGPPELDEEETAEVFRVVAIDFVNEPQALNIPAGPLATPEGQAAALWTIAIRTTPATIVAED